MSKQIKNGALLLWVISNAVLLGGSLKTDYGKVLGPQYATAAWWYFAIGGLAIVAGYGVSVLRRMNSEA